MKRSLKLIFFVASFAVFSTVAIHGQGTVSLITPEGWKKQPVDNAYMNKRVADAAEQYKEYAPIPRIAFYDIGYPKDGAEFTQMNGYAILLVSALSQNSEELPIKRTYVNSGGKEIELNKLKEIKIKNGDATSQTVKTFGEYRTDTLYLFPVYLRFRSGQLLTDYAKNRVGMKLAEFDGSKPPSLQSLPASVPTEKMLSDDVLLRFMKREYPGYLDN